MPGPPARLDDADSDEALMSAYAGGKAGAFDRLYARHRVWLYNLLARQLQDRARADDVFQETWYALIRSAPSYRPTARFSTWLYLLARQRLVDHWRRLDPETVSLAFNDNGEPEDPAVMSALIDLQADPARDAERRQLAVQLDQGLRALPPLQREVFLLAEQVEMSVEEIAVITGSNREAVKSRLRYARRKLAEHLAHLAQDWKQGRT